MRFSGAGSGRGNAQRHDGLGQPQFSLRRKGPRWVAPPRNALISRYSQVRNMGQLLIQLVVCALSMFVTVAVTASLLTTMFYALPKALLGWFRGAYSWKLPLFYFGGILILVILPGAVLSGAYYLLRWKSPEALKLVRDGWGIEWGISAGIGVSVISRCAQRTRLGMKREFEQMALLYGRIR